MIGKRVSPRKAGPPSDLGDRVSADDQTQQAYRTGLRLRSPQASAGLCCIKTLIPSRSGQDCGRVQRYERVRSGHECASLLPVILASYFGIVLGLGGMANGWRTAHTAWGAPTAVGETVFGIAGAVWFVVTLLYVWKWIGATEPALEEASHPI